MREVRGLFTRANILARIFGLCSMAVKTILYKSFCMSFYGMVLWKYFTAGAINRLRFCYRKCIKTFLVTPEVTVWLLCLYSLVYPLLIRCYIIVMLDWLANSIIVITVLLQNSSYYMQSFFKVVNIIACVLLVVSIISFFSFLCFLSVSVCCSMGFVPELKIYVHTYIHT